LKEQNDCDEMIGLIPDETGAAIGATVPVDTPVLVYDVLTFNLNFTRISHNKTHIDDSWVENTRTISRRVSARYTASSRVYTNTNIWWTIKALLSLNLTYLVVLSYLSESVS
jgi:hypothetical protein